MKKRAVLVKYLRAIIVSFIVACSTMLFPQQVSAQSKELAVIETRLAAEYSVAQDAKDSSEILSEKFGARLKKLISDHPSFMDYPFQYLRQAHVFVSTSPDGKLRTYSWDKNAGGTMHFFDNIFQYRANGKVAIHIPHLDEGDPGEFVSKIYSVTINGAPCYLVIGNSIGSTKDVSQSVQVYSIQNGKLTNTKKLFKTKTALLNRIDVPFDFSSVADRPERPLELITFDPQKKKLYIPVVTDKGKVTGRRIVYQLKGKYLEYTGIEK